MKTVDIFIEIGTWLIGSSVVMLLMMCFLAICIKGYKYLKENINQ